MTMTDRVARPADIALMAGVILLLRRMRSDLDRTGRLRRGTRIGIWTAYAAFGALLTDTLVRHGHEVPVGQRTAGYAVAAAGATLAGAGMASFTGPEQLNGGKTGDLITSGIYAYSRHPQYAGFIAAATGLAAARGSDRAAFLATELAVTLRVWASIEEVHLKRQFGAAYERVCRRVPRWIGIPSSAGSAG